MSTLTAFDFIQERSEATPGLWNRAFSQLSDNLASVNDGPVTPSTGTFSVFNSIDASEHVHAGEGMGIGPVPSAITTGAMTIAVRSDTSDYIHFEDSSALRSDYLIGSRVGGTADGLNIYDLSGQTMLASFSKQSIRFYQNVVGPVFDLGGANTDTYNAATFGTGSQSTESRVQSAINQASIDGISRVYVPASMYPYSASSVSFIYTVQMVREGGNWDVYDVQAYGADARGIASATSAFQATLNATTNNKGAMYVSTGVYRCGNINDATSARVAVYSTSGATIQSTDSIWLRIRPISGAKTGVTLRDLSFGPPLSNNTWGSPMILLHGDSSVGGIIQFDINNIKFQFQNAACDGLHLRACFEGRVANIWGYPSNCSSRLILCTAEDFNSGNIQFDTIEAYSGIGLQLNRAFNSAGNNQLLNQVLVNNFKMVRSPGEQSAKYVTTTYLHPAGVSTLSLAAADVTSITTGDWVVCADPYLAGDCFRVLSKLSSTMVQLSGPLPSAITSLTTLPVGTFGLVILGNTDGVQVNSPHFEAVGWGIVCSTSKQVNIWNPMFGSGVARGVMCKNGAQNTKVWYPIYSKSETTKILMEIHDENLANVNNINHALIGPVGFSSGAGPGSFLSDPNTDTAQNVYWPLPDTTVQALLGSATAPSIMFKSENSLGLYRSAASVMALSYGTFQAAGLVSTSVLSASTSSVGLFSALAPTSDRTIKSSHRFRIQGSSVNLENANVTLFTNNSATGVGNNLTWTAINASSVETTVGRFNGVLNSATAGAERGVIIVSTMQTGVVTEIARFQDIGGFTVLSGTAVAPGLGWTSERSLGWYRSAASTMALSYGTLLVNGPMWSSGISVGPGGTQIPAISSMSSLVGAFVVQGSASSFTGIAWTAAGIGDIILCAPFQSGAASSVSSGLVPHSLVTVAGQIEFRLSNVSTLVQNQSAQTWVFTRIRPF